MDIETGDAKIVKRENDVLICRPRLEKAVAILHHAPEKMPDPLIILVRHLIVRGKDKSFDDYDRDIRRAIWLDEELQEARIEFLRDEGWGQVYVGDPGERGTPAPASRSVGFIMAVRRVPNPERASWPGWCFKVWDAMEDAPRIQINMGKWPRVWHKTIRDSEGRGGISDRFETREEANALKCRIEEGRDLPWLPRIS